MVNSFGSERGISRGNNDEMCKRCNVEEPMDDSDYCRDCAEHLASLIA